MGGKGSNYPPTERQDASQTRHPGPLFPALPVTHAQGGRQVAGQKARPRSLSQPFIPDGLSSRVDLGATLVICPCSPLEPTGKDCPEAR